MTGELTLTETRYYYHGGSYWVVSGANLYQFDGSLFNTWEPGNETYGYMMRLFRSKPTIPRSAALEELKNLLALIETLK
jgi:hypothetical protein